MYTMKSTHLDIYFRFITIYRRLYILAVFCLYGVSCYLTENTSCLFANGSISWQTRILERYFEMESISLLGCAQECMIRKRCKSFNYKKGLNFCELSYVEMKDGRRDESKLGMLFIHGDVRHFDKNLIGRCKSHGCDVNSRCDMKTGSCQISDCGKEMVIPNTTVVSYGHHEIGNGVVYRCLPQSKMVSSEDESPLRESTVKCEANGTWAVPKFNCQYDGDDTNALQKEDDLTVYTDVLTTTSISDLTTALEAIPASFCPTDWDTNNNSAYCFILLWSNWVNAKASCHSMGADLVKVDGKTELNWLVDTSKEKDLGNFWTGGNDRAVEGHYVWDMDNSDMDSDLLYIDKPLSTKDCFYSNKKHRKLYSGVCSYHRTRVCERAI